MNKEITLKLSPKEFRIILESLLFTGCTEVSINNYKEDIEATTELAIDLRKQFQHVPTSNTFLNSTDYIFSENVYKIREYFPELVLN
jgi:hypothetical protein